MKNVLLNEKKNIGDILKYNVPNIVVYNDVRHIMSCCVGS